MSEGVWPAPYDGAYLLAEVDGPVHLAFGPYDGTQALYYLAYGDGTVHRVRFNQSR